VALSGAARPAVGRRLAWAFGLFALVVVIGLLQPTGTLALFDTLGMKVVLRLREFPGASLVTVVADILDRIGAAGGRLFIALTLCAFLARAGRPRALFWLLATVTAIMLINPLMKLFFAAPRPDMIDPYVVVTSPSFPSGHTAGAMVLYGAIAMLWRRPLVQLFCLGMILATGASRVWLGVHWPSDVIGGWLEGAAWLIVMSLALPGRTHHAPSARFAGR